MMEMPELEDKVKDLRVSVLSRSVVHYIEELKFDREKSPRRSLVIWTLSLFKSNQTMRRYKEREEKSYNIVIRNVLTAVNEIGYKIE